jgi:hypothetical protein
MQDDQTTNLILTDPQSDASCSPNRQNSSEIARPVTIAAGTNEVAMWSLQLYIGLFSKLPLTIPGAHGVHLSIHLQPRD